MVTAGILIGNAVTAGGMNAVMSEIHGMAQRGGVVLAELRLGDVFGPIIPDGATDLLLGFEVVEALRAMKRVGRETTVIVSTERIVPFTVNVGDASYPRVEPLLSKLRGTGVKLYTIDASELAKDAGNALASNVVLVGAAYSAGFVPVKRSELVRSIEGQFPERIREANLKAFELGEEAFRSMKEDGWKSGEDSRTH